MCSADEILASVSMVNLRYQKPAALGVQEEKAQVSCSYFRPTDPAGTNVYDAKLREFQVVMKGSEKYLAIMSQVRSYG